MKFGPVILMRIAKVVAIKCQILRLKCTKSDFCCGSAPDPAVGAYIFTVYCLRREQRSAAGLRRCPFLRAILGLPVTVRELSDNVTVCSRFTVRAPLSEARHATALSFASCNSIEIIYANSAAGVLARPTMMLKRYVCIQNVTK